MKPLDLSKVNTFLVIDGDPKGTAKSRIPKNGIHRLRPTKRWSMGQKGQRYHILYDEDRRSHDLHFDLALEPVEALKSVWQLVFCNHGDAYGHAEIERIMGITDGVLHLWVPTAGNPRLGIMHHPLGLDEVYYVAVREPTPRDLIENLVEREIR